MTLDLHPLLLPLLKGDDDALMHARATHPGAHDGPFRGVPSAARLGWNWMTWMARIWRQVERHTPLAYEFQRRRECVDQYNEAHIIDFFHAPDAWDAPRDPSVKRKRRPLGESRGSLVKDKYGSSLRWRCRSSSDRYCEHLDALSDVLSCMAGHINPMSACTHWMAPLVFPEREAESTWGFRQVNPPPPTDFSSWTPTTFWGWGVLAPIWCHPLVWEGEDGTQVPLHRGRWRRRSFGDTPDALGDEEPATLLETLEAAIENLVAHARGLEVVQQAGPRLRELVDVPEVEALAWLLAWRDAARRLGWGHIARALAEAALDISVPDLEAMQQRFQGLGAVCELLPHLELGTARLCSRLRFESFALVPANPKDRRPGVWRARGIDAEGVGTGLYLEGRLLEYLAEELVMRWWERPELTPTRLPAEMTKPRG